MMALRHWTVLPTCCFLLPTADGDDGDEDDDDEEEDTACDDDWITLSVQDAVYHAAALSG